MAMPTWDEFMAPVLRALLDGEVRRRRDLYDLVAAAESLTDEQKSETLSSGQLKYQNRIGWAISYLIRVAALQRPARGHYSVADNGRRLLAEHPDGITERHLRELVDDPRVARVTQVVGVSDEEPIKDLDPDEQIAQGIDRIDANVAAELLDRLHAQDPAFFEQAVLDLLMAMGYGGAQGTATRTQLSHDGGIDGVVDQDALGLSRIYVQAKRYALDATIGRPVIQGFVGALHGNQANQGVFITTARFSTGATEYAHSVPSRVILIDGPRLAGLMIRFNVGVQVKRTVHLVEVDEDFFE